MANDHPLYQQADDHDENGASYDRSNEGVRVAIGQPASITAKHEHGAVREIEDAERAVDDGQTGRDQREQSAQHQAVETLRYEIGPIDHQSSNSGPVVVTPPGG